MPENPTNPELLPALGRMVRGLSALFWGLPTALLICIQCAKLDTLRDLNLLPPLMVTCWLLYGLWQLGYFRKQERVWIRSLNRAKELAVINVGLSPFLFWYGRQPGEKFFAIMVGILAINSVFFLRQLNTVLFQISAMLPDEALREETRHFTSLNRHALFGILVMAAACSVLLYYPIPIRLPYFGGTFLLSPDVLWFLVFLALLPLALTMAMVWKIKEVILAGVFGG